MTVGIDSCVQGCELGVEQCSAVKVRCRVRSYITQKEQLSIRSCRQPHDHLLELSICKVSARMIRRVMQTKRQ
jgi:hypothetical protein